MTQDNQYIEDAQSIGTPSSANKSRWHKEFWPWFIVLITILVLFACLATIIIAQKQNERIPMDYQKNGLTITKERLANAGDVEGSQAVQANSLD